MRSSAEKSPVRRFLAEWAVHRGSLSNDRVQTKTIYPIDLAIDLSPALYSTTESTRLHHLRRQRLLERPLQIPCSRSFLSPSGAKGREEASEIVGGVIWR